MRIACALKITYSNSWRKTNSQITENNKLHMQPSVQASKKLENNSKMNKTCITIISLLSFLSSKYNITHDIILTVLPVLLSCLEFDDLSGHLHSPILQCYGKNEYPTQVHSKPRLHVSSKLLNYGRHVARLLRCRRRAYAPTGNTANHDNHK